MRMSTDSWGLLARTCKLRGGFARLLLVEPCSDQFAHEIPLRELAAVGKQTGDHANILCLLNELDQVDAEAYYASNAISHNMWHENTGQWPKYYGSEMLFEDPLFVKEPEFLGDPGDFQLQEDSPAIGAGTDVGLGTPIDMGAFQHGRKPWYAGIPK